MWDKVCNFMKSFEMYCNICNSAKNRTFQTHQVLLPMIYNMISLISKVLNSLDKPQVLPASPAGLRLTGKPHERHLQ